MTTTDERRENARRGHHACKKCGGMYTTDELDGSKCGGLPGITYKVCRCCGDATAKVRRRSYKAAGLAAIRKPKGESP